MELQEQWAIVSAWACGSKVKISTKEEATQE
jgi:hypothetical protein